MHCNNSPHLPQGQSLRKVGRIYRLWYNFYMGAEDENPFLVRFLLKNGIVKDVRQADIALIVFVVFLILLSIFIFYFFTNTGREGSLTPQENNFLNSPSGKKTPAEYDATLFSN